MGAAILILCVLYTTLTVKEWSPQEYAEYNGIVTESTTSPNNKKGQESGSWLTLLRNAPTTFWTVGLVQFFCWVAFMYMWTYTNGTIAHTVWNTSDVTSAGYQEAGNWVGVLFAIQAIGSVIWAIILPKIPGQKLAYALSLIIGGIGFILVPFVHDQYLLFVPYLLIGCAWAAMLAMPFAIVTNALQGYGHMGVYLGLFNGTICVPQIAAAALGGVILSLVGSVQGNMLIIAGLCLIIGSLCVGLIKTSQASKE